jgi:hypothetical protein
VSAAWTGANGWFARHGNIWLFQLTAPWDQLLHYLAIPEARFKRDSTGQPHPPKKPPTKQTKKIKKKPKKETKERHEKKKPPAWMVTGGVLASEQQPSAVRAFEELLRVLGRRSQEPGGCCS